MTHERVQDLAAAAREAGKTNVAFLANFLLQNVDACIDILVAAGRAPEATFFARAYRPSRVDELVKVWQEDLKKVNAKAAESLASPTEYPNLFPDWEAALKVRVQLLVIHSAKFWSFDMHLAVCDQSASASVVGLHRRQQAPCTLVGTNMLCAALGVRRRCQTCPGSCALRSFAGR